jgi:hypothetical protein
VPASALLAIALTAAGCAVQTESKEPSGEPTVAPNAPPTPPPAQAETERAAGAVKPDGLFGPPSITASNSSNWVQFSGSNFTANGQVFVGTWNGNAWSASEWVTASAAGSFCNPTTHQCYYFPGGGISGNFYTFCNTKQTVYAYDNATGAFSNGVSLNIQCIQ